MRESAHQHVAPMIGRVRPHTIGAVRSATTIGDVLRRARIAAHALQESVVVEMIAPRHVDRVAPRGGIERGALVQRRKMVGVTERVQGEGVGRSVNKKVCSKNEYEDKQSH